jgi:Ras GTPase-activating-like protein IQGAP2/3
MDEYSDMVAVAKPMVYITVGELVSTHRVRDHKLEGTR